MILCDLARHGENSPLAAVVPGGDPRHVFYVGPDGALATTWGPGSSIAVVTGW